MILKCVLFICVSVIQWVAADFVYRGSNCGYKSCHPTKPGLLNVHIVCHTHLDTGWVETYDEYYHRYVKVIYDSVVQTLFEQANRKFIVVESSFFSRWFNEQTDTVRNRVFWLVRSGQMEFTSGGWSMNDEATANYQDVIDEMTLGTRWLNRTFGECGIPRVGWQIDPFGHSREQASIFSQMGFDGLFLGRIDFQDKILRETSQSLEFVWKASPSLGPKADLFTGVLPNVYWPPTGFCWDVNCYDEPIYERNAERKARDFIKHVKKQAEMYGTNHTIITMGMDFYFRDARKWFTNLDRLIAAVNALEREEGVHMLYSTPACYLKSLHEIRRKWPVKLDDFFPYADAYNAYWSGYYTSRPSLKYHIRYGNNVLQVAKQLHVLAGMDDLHYSKIRPLQETMGILQHHDAVTGTCKQYVANDYTRMLTQGINAAEEAIVDSYDRIWLKEGLIPTASLIFCNQLNISSCDVTELLTPTSDVVINIYNPIAHSVRHYVRLPIKGLGHRVKDSSGAVVTSQLVTNHLAVTLLPGRHSTSEAELVFRALLPPLGFSSYVVDVVDPHVLKNPNQISQIIDGSKFFDEASISNGRISAVVEAKTGLLKSVILKDGRVVPIHQNFHIYQAEGRFLGEKPSGAYAFNPANSRPLPATDRASFSIVRGPLVEEIHQTISPWISQVIRIYQHVDYIEFDWVVGPIPVDNYFFDQGQEVISRYETLLQTNGTFFTDANGRETIRRIRDRRPTWDVDTTEHVASNYYPVTGWIFIRDYEKDLQVTVLPDRSEGGSSLDNGVLELMVHRRLLADDGYGMDEALNEPGIDGKGLICRGKHRLIVNDIQESVRQMRIMSKSLNLKPIMTFRKRNLASQLPFRSSAHHAARSLDNSQFIGLNKKLPPNIHLLTLEPWDDRRILLRLEHFFEVNEDSKFSKPRRVSLTDLFAPFVVIEAVEMTINANQEKRASDSQRFRWMPEVDPYANYSNVLTQLDSEDLELIGEPIRGGGNPWVLTLFPMEIRTFLLRVEDRKNCPYSGLNVPLRRGKLRTPNC